MSEYWVEGVPGTTSGIGAGNYWVEGVPVDAESVGIVTVDTATLYLDLVASGEVEDVYGMVLALTPDGLDEYSGIEALVDAATIRLSLAPSALRATDTPDSGQYRLRLQPLTTGEIYFRGYQDASDLYLDITPVGKDVYHTCKPRLRGELHTAYQMGPFHTSYSPTTYMNTWRGELLPVAKVVNYAC
jgi:hypothetical protein